MAVIATTIRNEDTYACFKEMLGKTTTTLLSIIFFCYSVCNFFVYTNIVEREGLKISVMSPPSHIPTLYYDRFSNYEMLTLRT